eukprot:Tbor_TRINITY_DN2438_c0_g1::TRINITY_DN2438_c0_g1_i1::g.2548::m.2548
MNIQPNISSSQPNICEDMPVSLGNGLGLFLLEVWGFLEPNDQRTMEAIGPDVRWYQELAIDRHEFGLVWTTAPPEKVDEWVRHGGGHGSAESGRVLLGVSETEHWATAEPIIGEKIINSQGRLCAYPKRINPQCRLRALIVNPVVIA